MSSIKKAIEVWDSVLERMNSNPEISDYQMMNGFMKALVPQLLSDEYFVLSVDNKWAQEYIELHYKKLMNKELTAVMGHYCEVVIAPSKPEENIPNETQRENEEITINQNQSFAPLEEKLFERHIDNEINTGLFAKENESSTNDSLRSTDYSQSNTNTSHTFHTKAEIDAETALRQIEVRKIDPNRKTFDTFVVADTNMLAYSAALSVAENPGEVANPLFIYGRSGLGKTHLLLAIKDYVNSNYPEKIVYYSPATTLIDDYVNSLATNDWNDFSLKYRNVDVLLIDDIQFLERAVETTNEFFKILNTMTSSNKQVVLSSDRAPKDIDLDERLISRFANGITADIQAPMFETKLKIFQNTLEGLKAMHNSPDLYIPQEVINRVVELSNSNIRNLEGAAANLILYITVNKKDDETISVEEAENIISKIFFTNMNEKITISNIQSTVESYYKVTHGELLGKQRPRHISQARQVGMYLSRTLTQASYPEIGRAFNKDHSSVVHAYKNIEKKRQTDREFLSELERISDMVTAKAENQDNS